MKYKDFKMLSENDMKHILGGTAGEEKEIEAGRCTGSTGEWIYTSLVTQSTCLADVSSDCGSTLGQCKRKGEGWPA